MTSTKLSGILFLGLCVSLAGNVWQWRQSSEPKSTETPVVEKRERVPEKPERATPVETSPSLSELVLVWFNDQQHEQAIQAYAWLQQSDEQQANQVFSRLLAQLHQRLEVVDTVFVEGALRPWLDAFPYNASLQLVFAQLCEQQKRFADASNAYFDLADGALSDGEQRQFTAQARELANQYLNQLSQAKQWQTMIEFIDQLIWREPNHVPHIINLAKAYIADGQLDQARIHLITASHFPDYQKEAERLLVAITPEDTQTDSVPARRVGEIALQPLDNHFLVPLVINRRAQASLIIDTGASLTVLSRSSFERLNIARNAQFVSSARMNTAGGIAIADIYQVSEMSVGRFVVNNERIAVMDLQGLGSDGLLGMNFLGAFNFQINTEAKTLSLSSK